MFATGFGHNDFQTGFFGPMVNRGSLRRTLEGLTNVARKQTVDVDETEVIQKFAVQTQLLLENIISELMNGNRDKKEGNLKIGG